MAHSIVTAIKVRHLYISPGHNFKGRHGMEPLLHPVLEVPSIECEAGQGIRGDRYFGHEENFKGQITFFAFEVHENLCRELGVIGTSPSIYRRNVITEGIDLNSLVGEEFELQGLRFLGTEECKPCYWMDCAVAPGAELAMKGRGGLRARILTGGRLRSDSRLEV